MRLSKFGAFRQYQWIIDQHNESLRKKIKVACPVNVYVYDSNGKLVAYAENGRVSSTGPVTIALNDDVKTIYFYDDAKYNIQYTGPEREIWILPFLNLMQPKLRQER